MYNVISDSTGNINAFDEFFDKVKSCESMGLVSEITGQDLDKYFSSDGRIKRKFKKLFKNCNGRGWLGHFKPETMSAKNTHVIAFGNPERKLEQGDNQAIVQANVRSYRTAGFFATCTQGKVLLHSGLLTRPHRRIDFLDWIERKCNKKFVCSENIVCSENPPRRGPAIIIAELFADDSSFYDQITEFVKQAEEFKNQ